MFIRSLKKIAEAHREFGRSQHPAVVAVDVFALQGRCAVLPPGVAHIVGSDADFEREIPTHRERPRISVADAEAGQPAFVMRVCVAHVVECGGQVRRDEVTRILFEEPVPDAGLYRRDAGLQMLRADRIPKERQLHRPVRGDGGVEAQVKRAGGQQRGVDSQRVVLRRSAGCRQGAAEQQHQKR